MYMRRKDAKGQRRRAIRERTWERHSQTVRRAFSWGARRSLFIPCFTVRGEGEEGGELPRSREFKGRSLRSRWAGGEALRARLNLHGEQPRALLARKPRDNEFEEDPARGPGSPPIDKPSRGEFSRALPGPATGGPRTAWGDRLAQPRDGPWPALGTTPGPAAGGPCAAGGGWPALPNDGP